MPDALVVPVRVEVEGSESLQGGELAMAANILPQRLVHCLALRAVLSNKLGCVEQPVVDREVGGHPKSLHMGLCSGKNRRAGAAPATTA